MNPNAKPFSFNPSASSWSPSGASTPIAPGLSLPPPPPKEEVKVEEVTVEEKTVEEVVKQTEELAVSQEKDDEKGEENNDDNDEEEDDEDDEDEPLDENDPLWIATLKVSDGDREAALRLLDDPDALMAYPEIVAIMESTASSVDDDEDWESKAEDESSDLKATAKKSTVAKKQKPGKKVVEEEEEEETDVDPREHMNIVFIGHVDAGKSTLSGSILYLMGKVDARTIERFEKEAKNRNRESWFLAFIMDTSEEERAKGKTVEVRDLLWII